MLPICIGTVVTLKLSLRQFTEAISDFEQAIRLMNDMEDEIEYYQAELVPEIEKLILNQDSTLLSAPTPITPETLTALKDVYKGTLKSSTYYHYALAHYLLGNFSEAAELYKSTLSYCVDDDMTVATTDWLYMSLRRSGQNSEADALLEQTSTDMHINEPSYHRRMRMYKRELKPDDLLAPDTTDRRTLATQGYGVGNWLLCNGDTSQAKEVFKRIINHGQPAAFGYIAAEADLKRLDG